MQRDVKAATDGAIGGLIGTAAMSALMAAAESAGIMGKHPPEVITEKALTAMGLGDADEKTQDALATALHFGFGAAAGALFGVLHRRLRPPIGAAVHGVIFGSLVWVTSYKGWIPAFGILPPPERDRNGRPEAMFLAHLIYGGTVGAYVEATKEGGSPSAAD